MCFLPWCFVLLVINILNHNANFLHTLLVTKQHALETFLLTYAKMQKCSMQKLPNMLMLILFFQFLQRFFLNKKFYVFKIKLFYKFCINFSIGFLSTGFIFLTKHHLKHLIKLFSFLGNRKDELPSQALISEITRRCRKKEHCAVYQVANP